MPEDIRDKMLRSDGAAEIQSTGSNIVEMGTRLPQAADYAMTEVRRFCHTEKFAGFASDVVSIPFGVDQKMLFLSGISAEAPDGRWLHADVSGSDISAQLRCVWLRIGEILGFHGATYGDIVKVTFYTTDARYLMNPIGTSIKDIFRDGRVPAFTGVVVVGLAWPELLVEIDVTAVVRSNPQGSTP